MMRKYILIWIVCLGSIIPGTLGQSVKNVKINEILVKNEASFTDDHSNHTSWIELFNSSYTSADVSGSYLRLVQGSDTITYRIPKLDERTKIAPRGYLLFFASGSSNKGTFHTNFELNQIDSLKLKSLEGVDDRLELLDQSGTRIIDFIEYDLNSQIPDISYGRFTDTENGSIRLIALPSTTPMQSNDLEESVSKAELFRGRDPYGISMAIVAMTVVFIALIVLFLVFKMVGKLMQHYTLKQEKLDIGDTQLSTANNFNVDAEDISGESVAAIAMSLTLYFQDLHDIESEIITINRVARVYSPWSSKIHTLTQTPLK